MTIGTSRDPSGALAVRGPLPVGETEIALRFLLPIERDDPLFSQVMPLDTPLVSVLVADTGSRSKRADCTGSARSACRIATTSTSRPSRFQPANPSNSDCDRSKRADRCQKPAAAGVALAAAAIAIGFLIAPLRHAGAETSVPPSAASRAADQRGSVLTAIRGLDEDFEIGKLTEADYREMRQTLRAEAVELLRVERAALEEAAGTERAARRGCRNAPQLAEAAGTERAALAGAAGADGTPRSCPNCEAETGADARFCSQCGAPLDQGGPADGASPV